MIINDNEPKHNVWLKIYLAIMLKSFKGYHNVYQCDSHSILIFDERCV